MTTRRKKGASPAETRAAAKKRSVPRRTARDAAARSDTAKAASGPEPSKSLHTYESKRDFAQSPEPKGAMVMGTGHRFCVQKHDARRLHYDLRLELDGVLKSWAITRGPSLVPGDKRLAVHTEDHPLEYLTFEGVIPKGEYGGGTMIVWDHGRWKPIGDPHKGYAKGHLEFTLEGERLKGRWHLVRMRPRPREKKEQWLLLKADDPFARAAGQPEITEEERTSVISRRTNEDLAAGGDVREDHAARTETARGRGKSAPTQLRITGAREGLLPVFLPPSLATLVDKAPKGDRWIHEIKFDGYRLQARIDGKKIKLLTRKGLDWTEKFEPIEKAFRDLKLASALIDGELVVEDEAGISSFPGLQADLKAGRNERLVFYAFDLLYHDGQDLTRVPLIERKTLLAGLLDDVPADGPIRFSSHIERNGEAMVRHACRLGLEGIVSKQKDKPYFAGRGTHWQKTKCTQRQEFVIVGYVPSTTSRKAVGSLVMAVHDGGELAHVGRVGTGFTEALSTSLWADLEALKRSDPPFARRLSADAAWCTVGGAEARSRGGAQRLDRGRAHSPRLLQGPAGRQGPEGRRQGIPRCARAECREYA
jgi:bifunctional non-homologous end joining protein LigD